LLSRDIEPPDCRDSSHDRQPRGTSLIFLAVIAFFGVHVLIWELNLETTDRALTYWRAMHLSSGVSPVVPIIALLVGLYLWFWFTLHGLALFGSDRPRLPLLEDLKLKVKAKEYDFLRMFSQEDAAEKIERAGKPLDQKTRMITVFLFVLFLVASLTLADGVFLRGLGAKRNVVILMLWLLACISLQLSEACRLCELWREPDTGHDARHFVGQCVENGRKRS
jgi:hypothetical protein